VKEDIKIRSNKPFEFRVGENSSLLKKYEIIKFKIKKPLRMKNTIASSCLNLSIENNNFIIRLEFSSNKYDTNKNEVI
jgi:hypothetical protein